MMRMRSVGCLTAALALTGTAFGQLDRVSTNHKGSLLLFSKVEIKWDAQGKVLQDTIVDITNDYPENVAIQGYFVNGDIELAQVRDSAGTVVQQYEPGWNTADCRFELTGNQPHFWSAAKGSDKCQPFTVLDPDGPGRPDPETMGATRILRGYVLFYAVKYDPTIGSTGSWVEIRWNHLKGDAALVNYANGSGWEYNAWAFRATTNVPHGGVLPTPGTLNLDGAEYDQPYDTLLLDFYGSGSTALTGGGQNVMIDTDLTLNIVSTDLRQDSCGPILTKIEAEIWNEFETKFSGTRRCICCWDQTMLSNWVRSVAIPNHFTRAALRTDKGKARLDGVYSTECDYVELCGPTAVQKRETCGRLEKRYGEYVNRLEQSEDTALLGLATKFMTFSPSGESATAGMNLVGMGYQSAVIDTDIMVGPDELSDATSRAIGSTRDAKTGTTERATTSTRASEDPPAE